MVNYGDEEKLLIVDAGILFKVFVHEHSSALHWHKYLEVIYIMEGRVAVKIGEDEFIGKPGDLFFINYGEDHYTGFVDREPHKLLCIQFDKNILYSMSGLEYEWKYLIPLVDNRIGYPKYMDVKADSTAQSILNDLLDECSRKKIGYEMVVKADIYRLIVWYHRASMNTMEYQNQDGMRALAYDGRLAKVFDFVNQNYRDDITTRDAADICFLSYTYFCRFFRQKTGLTFMDYVNRVRITEAKKLLTTTDDSINCIVDKVGFKDNNYFTRLFKEVCQETPSKYRKRHIYER